MRGLDDTDREILRLLLENSRRPFSDIADAVGLSAPAVSDRIDRLRDIGIIRGFTIDVDRGLLRDGTRVLVTIRGVPGTGPQLRDALAEADAIEHLFVTADDTVVCTVVAADDVGAFLAAHAPLDAIRDYDIRVLRETDWTPTVDQAEFAPECVECGNAVGSDGERETVEGTTYHFCCPSCQAAFLDQYEELSEGAEG